MREVVACHCCSPELTPEVFSRLLIAEAGLPGAYVDAVAREVRRQLDDFVDYDPAAHDGEATRGRWSH